MKKTIFKRPLFVNPQAYTTIPELYSVNKLLSFNFDENDTYTTKLVYNGKVESIIKKAGEEHILHLDLYTVDGSCVLGEWYVKGIDSESVVTIDKNILTIVANNNLKYPGLIAAWSAKGKTNEDADRNVLKDLTGNGHDITLNNFAWNTESGYNNPKYPDALVFDGVDDYGINENMPMLTDYTIIAKRVRLGNYFVVSKYRYDTLQGAFRFESIANTFSYSSYNMIRAAKESIVFGTSVSYNGQTIKRGLSSDGPVLTLGSMTNELNFYEGAIYSIYLFNRILPDQEIKSFIRKHIDPEYLLPSEISAITLISNDTLIDNSTLIKNN